MRSVFFLSLLTLVGAQEWIRNYTVNPLAQYFSTCNASGLPFPLTPPTQYVGTLRLPANSPIGSSVDADLTIATLDGCHGTLSAVVLATLFVNWSFVIVNGSYLYVWDLSCNDMNSGFCNTFSCFLGPRQTDFGPGLYHIAYDTLNGTSLADCNRFSLSLVRDPCNRALNASEWSTNPARQCYGPTPSPTPTPAPTPTPTPTLAVVQTSNVPQPQSQPPTANNPSPAPPTPGVTSVSQAPQSSGGATAGSNCTSGGDCLSGTCQNRQCVSSASSLSFLVATLVILL